jgi:hypothetical protein
MLSLAHWLLALPASAERWPRPTAGKRLDFPELWRGELDLFRRHFHTIVVTVSATYYTCNSIAIIFIFIRFTDCV